DAVGQVRGRVEHHEHAQFAGGGGDGRAHGVAEVRGAVGPRGVGRAHGTGEHERLRPVPVALQQEGGLLERVGAVADDHAGGTGIDLGVRELEDAAQVRRTDRGGADVRDLAVEDLDPV